MKHITHPMINAFDCHTCCLRICSYSSLSKQFTLVNCLQLFPKLSLLPTVTMTISLLPPPPFPKKTVFDMEQYFTEVTKYMLTLPDEDVDDTPPVNSTLTIDSSASTENADKNLDTNRKDNNHSTTDRDSEWLSPITQEQFMLKQYHTEVEKLQSKLKYSQSLFKKGTIVSMFSRHIATLSLKPNNVRESRDKTMGTVVKKSEIFPDLFLVNFYDVKKYCYVTEDVIRYDSGCTPNSMSLAGSSSASGTNLSQANISADNEEVIMTSILNAKIYMTPGHNNLTMNELYSLFHPTYNWLTVRKMNYCLAKARKELANNVDYKRESVTQKQLTYTNVLTRKQASTSTAMSGVPIDGKLLHLLLNTFLYLLCIYTYNCYSMINSFILAIDSSKQVHKSGNRYSVASTGASMTRNCSKRETLTSKTINAVRDLKNGKDNCTNVDRNNECK